MIIFLKNKHTLQIDDFYFKCAIGKNGLSKKKVEGDKKTPKGTFEIQHLYYRSDRIKLPNTYLKTIEIYEKKLLKFMKSMKTFDFVSKLILGHLSAGFHSQI